jgi:MscS family membrane protein
MAVIARILWLAAVLAPAAPAQMPLPKPPAAKPATQEHGDLLGRDTPRSTLIGFLEAAQQGRYRRAAQFLQIKNLGRNETAEEAAEQMASVLNLQFKVPMEKISDEPEGHLEDGRSTGREMIGYLGTKDEPVPLVLVRVKAEDGKRIWLISSETVAKLPFLYAQVGSTSLWFPLPDWMQERWLGMRLWQWLALPVLIPPALLMAWMGLVILSFPWRLYRRARGLPRNPFLKTATPNLVCVTVWTHYLLASQVALPVLVREHHGHIARGTIFVWLLWWLWHLGNSALTRARMRAMASSRPAEGSLIQLSQRILKALFVIVVVFFMLSVLGFDMSTAIAGLGIGGIALALAAQKTIENLFGGISMATDKVIRVGDMCRFGTDQGWVEDIGIRSTRVRSLEGTELTIPNSVLSMMTIENFSKRDRFRFFTTIGVRYETTAAQMRQIAGEIRAILENHPKVSPDGLRVRFRGFGPSSLDIEINAFIQTTDMLDFASIREDLLIGMMEIVERAGSGFAFPSQTVYIASDTALNYRPGRVEQKARGE